MSTISSGREEKTSINFRKIIGLIAVATPFWFLIVYLIMAGMRPEYSYLTNFVSELGSVHAPHNWYWNVLGFILPGVAITLLGIGLKRDFSDGSRFAWIPAVALIASGLLFTLTGIFPADLTNMDSVTSQMHIIGAQFSFFVFLIAGFWLPFIFRKTEKWHWLTWPSLALVLLTIVTVLLTPVLSDELCQRLTFICYFSWIGLVGFGLFRYSKISNI